MTHISEERNIEAPPERIWAVIASTPRWMEFYRTHDNRGRLKKAEYLGKEADEVGARRRMHFVPGSGFTTLRWDLYFELTARAASSRGGRSRGGR